MGLLEPGAVKAARRGSEGAPAQQCAGATRPPSESGWGPGTAGESLAGQHGCGSRLAGQAVPGELALAGGAEVAVDLAGDVTLQAADDLFLRQAFLGAPLDIDESRRMGAHPCEHDPPQGVVGLAVAAGIEAVTSDFPRRCRDR